ncbi:unnamed protein product, partial [Amoebophrya sp. A25]
AKEAENADGSSATRVNHLDYHQSQSPLNESSQKRLLPDDQVVAFPLSSDRFDQQKDKIWLRRQPLVPAKQILLTDFGNLR